MTFCTSSAASSPSCDHSCSAAALSESVMALSIKSALSGAAAATASGTLLVDHATPVDHSPNDSGPSWRDAIATPTLPGRVRANALKPVSSA